MQSKVEGARVAQQAEEVEAVFWWDGGLGGDELVLPNALQEVGRSLRHHC